MKKPNIFLDFDGLKFHTASQLAIYMNGRFGINSKTSDYVNNQPLHIVLRTYISNIENYQTSIKWHEDMLPMEDMCETMYKLAKKYLLWTVTSREKTSVKTIRYLLDKHIPGCITGIHCVYEHRGSGVFNEVSKRDFIQSVSGEKIAFFDDSPSEILKTQDIIPSYLFDPDGLHDDIGQITNRVKNWKEIGDRFL